MSDETTFAGSRRSRRFRSNEFTVPSLFANGEVGVWYDPSDLTPEKVSWRRNLLTYSQDFENAAWTPTRASIIANTATAPDNTSTADKLVENTDTNTHFLRRTITLSVAPHTYSVYCKAAERSWVRLVDASITNGGAYFDLSNGTIGTVGANAVASITSVGSGWYRCVITVTTLSNGDSFDIRTATADNTDNYTGDGTSGILIWGAQLELGTTASAYQRITDFSSDFLAAFPTHTLYTTSTGVTPVTALGQSVGLVLDKSQGALSNIGPELVTNGTFDTDSDWTKGTNWSIGSGVATRVASVAASQLSQAQTLTAGALYQLTYTMTQSAGTLTPRFTGTTTVSATARTASGTYTEYLVAATGNNTLEFNASTGFTGTVDNVSLRLVPGHHARQTTDAARPTVQARSNLLTGTTTLATQTLAVLATQHTLSFTGTGTVTLSGTSTAGPLVGTGVNDRVSLTFTPTAGNLTLTVSGTVTDAQLERNSAFTTYQRVVTATDYADVGLPRSFTFDGIDDSFVTAGNVNFSGTDKMTVCAGVFKASDAAGAAIAELSASRSSNAGAWSLFGPVGAAANYSFISRGSIDPSATSATTFAAPIINVLTGIGDIAADISNLRVDGNTFIISSSDQGTGNYGSYPLYVGRRGGATNPFTGRIHQLIVRGAATDSVTIQQTERFVAQKTGVVL